MAIYSHEKHQGIFNADAKKAGIRVLSSHPPPLMSMLNIDPFCVQHKPNNRVEPRSLAFINVLFLHRVKFAVTPGKKCNSGEQAADRLILYLDTIQKAVKNHPVWSISLCEPRQPFHKVISLQRKRVRPKISGRIWNLREGMEKRGWKSVKTLCSHVGAGSLMGV